MWNPTAVSSSPSPVPGNHSHLPALPLSPLPPMSGGHGLDQGSRILWTRVFPTVSSSSCLVAGQSGLGKSTLVNTLFKSQVSRKASSWNREEKIPKTVEIKAIGHVIEEGGVKMKLTVIDTPGFGDQINNENCWEPIEKYINEQYEKFLKEEVNIARKKRIPDTRVHCCLYFISPTGHSYVPVPPPTAAPGSGSCQLCPFCLGEPVSPDGTQCRQGSVIAQTFSKRV
uniref:Septin-type G domain-containing protein n=1 Tax=Ursus americanus TaxID=9643 RepID=A0A452QF00_URSAM